MDIVCVSLTLILQGCPRYGGFTGFGPEVLTNYSTWPKRPISVLAPLEKSYGKTGVEWPS